MVRRIFRLDGATNQKQFHVRGANGGFWLGAGGILPAAIAAYRVSKRGCETQLVELNINIWTRWPSGLIKATNS